MMVQNKISIMSLLMLLLISALLLEGCSSDAKATSGRVFEIRTYIAHDGRFEDLNSRFRNHTNTLFVKHGMQLVGYWEPIDEDDTLIYILAFPSVEAREKSWDDFRNDEVWKKAYAESTENGKLVKEIISHIMEPTDYSPIQ
ncbi:MAG: NIPSNAP family protein [Candidatus Marinimicrobia bacterium]|nr:NIPSNAP family protein [Candidatus Neomarinimicrobiota bacterium]|tara:strand:- start:6891 stop:7316 length:426 start_codon:yes stop_codon:yes gene_type:complete